MLVKFKEIAMQNEEPLQLKVNILGGEIYTPKTKEQRRAELSQKELANRLKKEALNGNKEIDT